MGHYWAARASPSFIDPAGVRVMGERKSGSVEGIHVSQGFSQEEGEGLRGAGGAVDAQVPQRVEQLDDE